MSNDPTLPEKISKAIEPLFGDDPTENDEIAARLIMFATTIFVQNMTNNANMSPTAGFARAHRIIADTAVAYDAQPPGAPEAAEGQGEDKIVRPPPIITPFSGTH